MDPFVEFVDGVDGDVGGEIPLCLEVHAPVVEQQRSSAQLDRQHGVIDLTGALAHDQDAHGPGGEAELAKGPVLGDGVVLTVAAPAERLAGRGPIVRHAVVPPVAAVADPAVDIPVDELDAGPGGEAPRLAHQPRPAALLERRAPAPVRQAGAQARRVLPHGIGPPHPVRVRGGGADRQRRHAEQRPHARLRRPQPSSRCLRGARDDRRRVDRVAARNRADDQNRRHKPGRRIGPRHLSPPPLF